jgi:hypothetical protein
MSSRSFATSSKSRSRRPGERKRKDVQARAQLAAEERVLDALVGANSSAATRDSFRRKLRAGELNDKEIDVETQSSGGMPMFEIPGMPGAQMGAISIGDIFGKLGGRTKTRRLTVEGSRRLAKLAGAPFHQGRSHEIHRGRRPDAGLRSLARGARSIWRTSTASQR